MVGIVKKLKNFLTQTVPKVFNKVKEGVSNALPFLKTIAQAVTTVIPQLAVIINPALNYVENGLNLANGFQKQKMGGATSADLTRQAIAQGIKVAPQIPALLRKLGV
jgi:phage-related protein